MTVEQYQIPNSREHGGQDEEQERRAQVETLTQTVGEILQVELSRQRKESSSTPEESVFLHERTSGDTSRYSSNFLQREDHLDGAVGIRRTVRDDETVEYELTRPGYKNNTLQYQWEEGGTEVKRGFSEGFSRERNGEPSGDYEHAQLPTALSAEEMKAFNAMVEELRETHLETEVPAPDGKLAKVRAAFSKIALGKRS